MWLNIGMLSAEELLGSLSGNVLHHVDTLAAAIVSLARITLGIFVSKNCSHGSHNCRGDDILRGDELDISLLTLELKLHGFAHLRVLGADEADCIHHIIEHIFLPFLLSGRPGTSLNFIILFISPKGNKLYFNNAFD